MLKKFRLLPTTLNNNFFQQESNFSRKSRKTEPLPFFPNSDRPSIIFPFIFHWVSCYYAYLFALKNYLPCIYYCRIKIQLHYAITEAQLLSQSAFMLSSIYCYYVRIFVCIVCMYKIAVMFSFQHIDKYVSIAQPSFWFYHLYLVEDPRITYIRDETIHICEIQNSKLTGLCKTTYSLG